MDITRDMEQSVLELSNLTDTLSFSAQEPVLNNAILSDTFASMFNTFNNTFGVTGSLLVKRCFNVWFWFITFIRSFFSSIGNYVNDHGRDFVTQLPERFAYFVTHIREHSIYMFNNARDLYTALPDDVKHMIIVGLIFYGIILLCSLLVGYYKKSNGPIDYRSKIGIGLVIYNVLHFLVTVILSLRLLFTIGYGLYRDTMDASVVSHRFFVLVIVSLCMYIPRGNLPNILEFIVEHTMIPFSIVYHALWTKINLVFIVSDLLAISLSPFFGSHAYYLTVCASIVNAVAGIYGYLYLENIVSLFVAVHSVTTLLICIYALSRTKTQERQALEKNRNDYNKKMGDYLNSIKGDKQKEKELKKALSILAAKGIVSSNLESNNVSTNYISKKKQKQIRRQKNNSKN